jgi:hypothetical protein
MMLLERQLIRKVMNKNEICVVCKNKTKIIFNINFKAVHICEDCAKAIFIQQAMWYIKEK